MQSPFGRGSGGLAGGFSAVGHGSDAAAQAAAQQARLRFQSLGGGGVLRETVRVVNASGGGAPAAPAAAQGGSGVPFGLAAASPFLALFGKIIKDKSGDRD